MYSNGVIVVLYEKPEQLIYYVCKYFYYKITFFS